MTVRTLIDGLSREERREAFEVLWQALLGEDSLEVPAWHGEVLSQRLTNPSAGPSLPLDDAIEEVRRRLDGRPPSA
ncbi:addiction module protein [Rosistilla oblonga]|uniref:Addiction module component n=1 Tax=Rosistilla oblonga TaxID=2527990 RepID=A0A518IWK0_9BACT|nr:hypothetical protein Mal33_34820 [Rosistilla oblonga]